MRDQGNSQLVDAYGEFFRRYDLMWHHFATPTFSEPFGRNACWGALKQWIERIQNDAGSKVWWVAAYERGASGMPHFHVLLGSEGDLAIPTIQSAWIHGFCHVRVYDRDQGGTFYLAKHFTFEDSDYLFDVPSAKVLQQLDSHHHQ